MIIELPEDMVLTAQSAYSLRLQAGGASRSDY